ncbi:MAG: 3'-5' exonuclease [Pseudobdellovibrio sp.]
MNFDIKSSWDQIPVVAFDTETSGAYPLESEIIELGAVKWFQGKIVGKFQTLLKPSKPLVPDNIRIHGITNEMVNGAPLMHDQLASFCEFINGSILLAHHAPFDLGFLAIEIENEKLNFPSNIHLCTSLLSRALLTTTNHKLQTLIKELNLSGGSAHRAYDDAYACLQVFLKCIEKLDAPVSIERLLQIQKKEIVWNNYKIIQSENKKILALADAIVKNKSLSIIYAGGQTKGQPRPISPKGIVRNPDGDYIQADCGLDMKRKRFYIEKILEVLES